MTVPGEAAGAPDHRLEQVLEALSARAPSQIAFHAGDCCTLAHRWFVGLARAQHARADGAPRWIGRRWKWGPTAWPVFWCELVESDRTDCGGLAALAWLALVASGRRVHRVQLVERFDARTGEGWRRQWARVQTCPQWTFGELVYHEAVAVESAGNGDVEGGPAALRIWDPTDSCWIEGKALSGYGSIAAVRCTPPDTGEAPAVLDWNGLSLRSGEWCLPTDCGRAAEESLAARRADTPLAGHARSGAARPVAAEGV